MSEDAIPSHLAEHRRLRQGTRYTATVVRAILEQWFTFDSVLDLGCGTGNWLNRFAVDSGRVVLGLEMEEFGGEDIEIDSNLILHIDLGRYLNLQRRFDLALCLEVAEHLDHQFAPMVVENCVRHSDIVLFSAAIPGQQGLHHVNEQLPGYWASLFEKHDYAVLDGVRPLIWDDPQIPVWYRQNMLLFVRRASSDFATIETRSRSSANRAPLALAHPEYLAYFSGAALRSGEAEVALSSQVTTLSNEVSALSRQIMNLQFNAAREADTNETLRRQTAALIATNETLRQQTAALTTQLKLKGDELRLVLNSTTWRAFGAVRRVAAVLPSPVRQAVRRVVGRTVRILTLPATRRISDRSTPAAPVPPDRNSGISGIPDPTRSNRRVVFVSGEVQTPGHEYRVLRYAKAAAAIAGKVDWLTLEDYERHREIIRSASTVILWRTANSPEVEAVIQLARDASAQILFDVDDLIFLPEIANAAIIDGIRSQNYLEGEVAALFLRFREVMEQADACFCTTRELADQIRRLGLIAYVLPNGFDYDAFAIARRAARRWCAAREGGQIRIGYASGSRTHQRDFGIAADAIARVLADHDDCRLVLFRAPGTGQPLLDIDEFQSFHSLADRIEWRDMVPLSDLPNEIARFDINLAPLETGNIFCECKSELKYFEAALVGVCTVASPTGPMARAISHGETGLLATTPEEWHKSLSDLVMQPDLRRRLADGAFIDVMTRFGPDIQQDCLSLALQEIEGGPNAAQASELRLIRRNHDRRQTPDIPPTDVLFSVDGLGVADVTVIIPLHDYANYILEALDSVHRQTLRDLDVIVVDDASTDDSAEIAVNWMREHAARFNRAVVLQNKANAGLALTRNVGFNAADTAFVLPLDADNRLRPRCCEVCLEVLRGASAGFAYPTIQTFGDSSGLTGTHEFSPGRLVAGNYIDAMALVGKWAWLKVGGYAPIKYGWEDYDFWCRFVENGIAGVHVREILADYRVHKASMLHTQTDVTANKERLISDLEQRHTWLRIARATTTAG